MGLFQRLRGLALFAAATFAFITTGLVSTAPVTVPAAVVAIGSLPSSAEAKVSFVTSLRQSRCSQIVSALGANAVFEVRSGTAPTTTAGAGTLPAATGTLLATLTAGSTVGTCTAASLDFDEASFTQTAGSHVSGTPGYVRAKTSGGTAIIDFEVCGTAPCFTFTGTVVTGQNVTVTTLVWTEGNI